MMSSCEIHALQGRKCHTYGKLKCLVEEWGVEGYFGGGDCCGGGRLERVQSIGG